MRSSLLPTLSALCLAAPLHADIAVRFAEGAPKDRFTIQNTSACPITQSTLLLDLSGSAGKLIFDVTGAGAGVEVFQPFDLVEGRDALAELPQVSDGQKQIALSITELAPQASIAFTIDVDDTLGAREITVTGSEIEGATVSHSVNGNTLTASFTVAASATLPVAGCTS